MGRFILRRIAFYSSTVSFQLSPAHPDAEVFFDRSKRLTDINDENEKYSIKQGVENETNLLLFNCRAIKCSDEIQNRKRQPPVHQVRVHIEYERDKYEVGVRENIHDRPD